MVGEKRLVDLVVDSVVVVVLTTLALLCLLPFVHILAVSLSSRSELAVGSVGILPVGFNLDNYRYLVLKDQGFLRSFGISLWRVVIGVTANLLMIIFTAYPLSLDRIYMPGRTAFKMIMLFGMLFSGGLIPVFLALRDLQLLNKFAVLILPGILSIFNTIVIINFFRGIPQEMTEAASLDGASHLDLLLRIYVPVSIPALATVTLFAAVSHWNSWFDGVLYINRTESWPLQSYLYTRVVMQQLQYSPLEQITDFTNITPQGQIAAFVFFASVPILLVYPFLQRYFVTGLTLGSVKG